MVRNLLVVCVVVAAVQAASASPLVEATFRQAATQEIDRIAREDGFSGAVIVAHNGTPILRVAEGVQDKKRQISNRVNTKFPIESITKQFTAAGILLLEQEGRLKLSDPISRYYPQMPPALAPITIAQLLTHSSGIVDCKPCGDQNFRDYREYVSESLQTHLAFQPGGGTLYSNAGYGLLAIAIENVSGLSYRQFLQRCFFSPFGMSNSGDGDEPAVMARGYFCPGGRENCREGTGANLKKMAGFNGVYSTVDDMLRWTRAVTRGRFLSPQSLKSMFHDYGHGYGFGWYVSEKLGRKLFWHTGSDGHAGYASIVDIFPDDHLTVIALTNNTGLSRGKATLTIDGKPVTIPASPVREVVDRIERLYFESGLH